MKEIRDYDICECGDYRFQHKNGGDECLMPDDIVHGFEPCLKFRLADYASEIPCLSNASTSKIAQHRLVSGVTGIYSETKDYARWKLRLIELITSDERVNSVIKIEEINCVLRDDCDYPESFRQGEIDAMYDSQ